MPILEVALRGGAVALLVLLILLLVRDASGMLSARFAALYAIGVASYVTVSASAFIGSTSIALMPVRLLSMGNPVVFWLLAATLFDDEFRPRRWHFILWVMLSGFGLLCWYFKLLTPNIVLLIVSLVCNVMGLRYALVGRTEDLVESRRELRMMFIAAAALYSIAQITTEFLLSGSSLRAIFEYVNAAGLIVIVYMFCFEMLSLRRDGSLISVDTRVRPPVTKSDSRSAIAEAVKQDEAWLAALRRVMERDRIYREEALTVAGLADKLNIPDYRLRRIINERLGYRNFTAFLNEYRLADAETSLSDPTLAETPILTIALSVGFQSIGPFNRTFKAKTGLTPTEYRQQKLANLERTVQQPKKT